MQALGIVLFVACGLLLFMAWKAGVARCLRAVGWLLISMASGWEHMRLEYRTSMAREITR